ncbi:HAD family hydrolase [candidate division KSB1 bacterium]|nr:HAD family hydrolase [candidate division KSB1 bacterium]
MLEEPKAVFLDRDGTISVEIGYIDNPADLKLFPFSVEALSELQKMGFKLVVVTNQSGVARGKFTESQVHEVNKMLRRLLGEKDVTLDEIYVCPHIPGGAVTEYGIECLCRKPGIEMLTRAQNKFKINMSNSYKVGDKISDVDCGKNAGTKSILVMTGYGEEQEKLLQDRSPDEQPDFVADSLKEAVEWIKNDLVS